MKAFFGKICAWIKSTATKVWKWSVAHKAIAITTAAVVVAGTTCAVVLPIALHEHSYAAEWSSDANNHWHDATCKHEEEKSDLAAHTYTNACDTTCDVCGYARTVGAHVYDNACDTKCNVCDAERTITHDHADTLTAGDTTHYYACSVCGDKKDEVAHTFDKTVVSSEYLKEAATATTKAQYYKSCVCGKASATEYFETEKAPANLQVSDISKTYDGTPVAEPTVTFDGVGAENFAYYKGDEKLTERPTDAGTYKVVVTVDETDTHAGDRVEREFTIAKVVVTIPTLEKVYDGYGEFEFVFEGPGGEEIDCLIDIGNANAGTYTDVAITYKSVSSENYEITATTVSAKINKKVLSNLTVDLTYAGTNSFEVPLGAANGIVAGDVADGIKVCITFASKNVGASVTGAGLDAEDNDNYTNYELDLTTCTANIVPKTLNYLEITKVYNGKRGFGENAGIYCQLGVEHGVIAGDTVFLETSDDFEYNVGKYYFVRMNSTDDRDTVWLLGDDAANYDFQGNDVVGEVTVTPKTLNYLEITKVYNGKEGFNDSFDRGYVLGTDHGVVSGDDVILGTNDDIEYNVGTYVLSDSNGNWSLDDSCYIVGADKDNYQFNYKENGAVATVTVTPKVLSNLDLSVVYNGESYFEVTYTGADLCPGDELILKIGTTSKNVGEYTIANGELEEIVCDGDGNESFNYEVAAETCKVTVTPKVLNVSKTFEYVGSDVAGRQLHAPDASLSGVIAGDELLIEILFESGNAGALVLTGEDAPYLDGADCDNYTLGTYTFAIAPKKLTLKAGETISVNKDYNGNTDYTISVSSNMFDGYVDADAAALWLTATLPSKNVGEYTDGVILKPYVGNSALGTVSHNYDFSEVEATVTVKPLTVSLSSYVKVEYNGTCEFALATPFDLTSANTSGGQDSVSDRDEVYITWIKTDSADITDETFAIDYILGGADAVNYDIDELGVEIIKKKLTNLEINVTEAVYDVPGTDGSETAIITLLVKDGVIPGETVQITVTNYAEQDLWSGTFELCLKSPDDLAQGQEIVALVASGDYANYELVADENGVVGLLNIVTNAFNSADTLAIVPVGPAGGTTWEGGIYALYTDHPGYWNIKPSENFCTVTVYDSEDKPVTMKGFEFYAAEPGNYYVYIAKNSTTAIGDTITFRYAEEVVNPDNGAYESRSVLGVTDGEYWFKINSDTNWGQSLAILDATNQEIDPTKYTVKAYDANFNLLEDVVYEDQEDIYRTGGESLSEKDIYIAVVLNEGLEFHIAVY